MVEKAYTLAEIEAAFRRGLEDDPAVDRDWERVKYALLPRFCVKYFSDGGGPWITYDGGKNVARATSEEAAIAIAKLLNAAHEAGTLGW